MEIITIEIGVFVLCRELPFLRWPWISRGMTSRALSSMCALGLGRNQVKFNQ